MKIFFYFFRKNGKSTFKDSFILKILMRNKRVFYTLGAVLSVVILVLLSALILYILISSNNEKKAQILNKNSKTSQLNSIKATNASWRSEFLVDSLNTDSTRLWKARLNRDAIGFIFV